MAEVRLQPLADAPASALVVVHGDPHPANALAVPSARAGAETGYVFVDRDGFVADRSYDLGVAMRDFCPAIQEQVRRSRHSRLLGPEARAEVPPTLAGWGGGGVPVWREWWPCRR